GRVAASAALDRRRLPRAVAAQECMRGAAADHERRVVARPRAGEVLVEVPDLECDLGCRRAGSGGGDLRRSRVRAVVGHLPHAARHLLFQSMEPSYRPASGMLWSLSTACTDWPMYTGS